MTILKKLTLTLLVVISVFSGSLRQLLNIDAPIEKSHRGGGSTGM